MQNHHKWANPPFIPVQQCGSKLATPQESSEEASSFAAADGAVASSNVVSSFGGITSSVTKTEEKEKDSVARLTNLLATIQKAQSSTSASGDLIINVQKGGNGQKKPVTVVQSAPIYGAITGCCGRAPDVHYYRTRF